MIPYDINLTDGIVTLRPPNIDDVPALVEAVQESVEQIMPWMDWCTPQYGEETARRWLTDLPGTGIEFILHHFHPALVRDLHSGHLRSDFRNDGYLRGKPAAAPDRPRRIAVPACAGSPLTRPF